SRWSTATSSSPFPPVPASASRWTRTACSSSAATPRTALSVCPPAPIPQESEHAFSCPHGRAHPARRTRRNRGQVEGRREGAFPAAATQRPVAPHLARRRAVLERQRVRRGQRQ